MADDIDVSDMPAPGAEGGPEDLTSDMPSPDALFKQRVGREGNPVEVKNFLAHPENWADNTKMTPSVEQAGRNIVGGGEAALNAATGFAAGVPAGVEFLGKSALHGVQYGLEAPFVGHKKAVENLTRRQENARAESDDTQKFWTYEPRTPEGQQVAQVPGELINDVVKKPIEAALPDNAAQTVEEAGGDVLRGAAALPGAALPGLLARGARAARGVAETVAARANPKAPAGTTFDSAGNAIPPAPQAPASAPAPSAAGATTGDTLLAEPDPIPPPNAAPPAAKPHLRPKAGQSAQEAAVEAGVLPAEQPDAQPAARTFAPPSEEGPQSTPTPDQQPARQQHLNDLNELSGGKLPQQRNSAVTGDYAETGVDWQHSRLNDEAGKAMQGQIATENDALHTAAQNVHDSMGSAARNSVDTETLEQRAGIVRRALTGIQDWFDKATNGMYDEARRTVGGNAIPELSRVKAFLDDDSNFSNTNAIALQRAAKTRLERLWTTGDPEKNAPPGSVSAAERFREFLNEQWHPDSNGVIKNLKNLTDADVAEHGGPGMFETARNLRAHSAQLLEHPVGVARALDTTDRAGSWKISDDKLMDHVANLPRDQFAHFVNALKSGAHLGNGELAEQSAAAIREIKAHMTSRMHAAARNADGTWNARNFYNKANQYSTKLPHVMNEREIGALKTLNNAGNTLRMDKSYPGAAAQAHNTGVVPQIVSKVAGTVGTAVGGIAHGPVGAVAGHMAGKAIENAAERFTERGAAAKRMEDVQSRISNIGGGKQRGSVSVFRENNASGESSASMEAQNRVRDEKAKGQHRFMIDPDGNVTPLTGVDSVDARAPQGSIIVQRGVGANPYTVLDRGGLPAPHANGLLNRAQGLGKLKDAELRLASQSEPLGARILGGKQRGAVGNLSKKIDETPLEGAPEGDRPNGLARAAANAYRKANGIKEEPLKDYRYVPPEVAREVANAYDAMKHDPTNPKVKASYDAFKAETLEQYKQALKAGVKFELDPNYPYEKPRQVMDDVRANNHMSIFPTEQGFGTEGVTGVGADHPMMEKAPIKMGGKDATYNDLFRAVHDYYGHVAEGNGFRANGEYNAWRAHRTMYSDAARPAMDSETLGQNSWVNSGPHAQTNTGASQTGTVYAEQKAGLLPPKVVKAAEQGVSAQERHVTNQLTDTERAQLRKDTFNKLVSQFHELLPPEQEFAAAALAGKAKKGWYRASAEAIANQFGPEDGPRFAGLLAAMSPQVSVQTNFQNALHTFLNWDKAGRPSSPSAIRKIMEDSSQRSADLKPGESNVLEAWVNNAVRALTADDPTSIKMSGPKVHSFYNNLIGNVNEVTNDAWMANFSKIDPTGSGNKMTGTGNSLGPGKTPTYLALSAKVRAAAKMLTNLTGETWTPAEVQETVWSWAKTAYEHAEELGDRTIPELVKHGLITDELLRSTPDFHQLFTSPEHRGALAKSRYATNDERVQSTKGAGAESSRPTEKEQAAKSTLLPFLGRAAERLEELRRERNPDVAPF